MKIEVNRNYGRVANNYLFSEIGKRAAAYTAAHPDKKIIKLGIGDVTLPLPKCVVSAMERAVAEMGEKSTFRGYAPEYGYDFLRGAIADYYHSRGVFVDLSEVFASDGAKSDLGNIVELFGENTVIIPDPVYPAYVDANLMSGRNIVYVAANADNGFLPSPDNSFAKSSIIYICSPNNPTGAVYDRAGLKEWVDYALKCGSLIIFDSAYEAFVCGGQPRSIFEIEGARGCAIEICSLSKTAGFTGTRCGWTIIPKELESQGFSLNAMWARRQATKFNGVPYVVQRGAEAALTAEGRAECAENIKYYKKNADCLSALLEKKNIWYTGGKNSPYVWLRCHDGRGSWQFFDYLLNEVQVIGTPGAGFGKQGEGYFRLTAFGNAQATLEAVERLKGVL